MCISFGSHCSGPRMPMTQYALRVEDEEWAIRIAVAEESRLWHQTSYVLGLGLTWSFHLLVIWFMQLLSFIHSPSSHNLAYIRAMINSITRTIQRPTLSLLLRTAKHPYLWESGPWLQVLREIITTISIMYNIDCHMACSTTIRPNPIQRLYALEAQKLIYEMHHHRYLFAQPST